MGISNSSSKNDNIILTSRIRLARNIYKMPFPHLMNQEQGEKVINDVSSAILESNSSIANDFKSIKMKELTELERLSMVEKHIISIDFARAYEKAGLVLDKNQNVSIMINEEDHVRLQVLYPGFKIREAYEYASKLDDLLEERISYAFDGDLGYLTSCPTNVGTGIRASVMLHLPALSFTKNINNILNSVTQLGMTIRGMYGEGSNAMGNIYQISNQVTLGLSEEEIINNLIAITQKIVDQEVRARQIFIEKQEVELEDDIYRALGILKYARYISTSESLNLLSRVRLGVEMEIIKDIDINTIDKLIDNVQPATLQLLEGRELDTAERDIIRARVVRETLK